MILTLKGLFLICLYKCRWYCFSNFCLQMKFCSHFATRWYFLSHFCLKMIFFLLLSTDVIFKSNNWTISLVYKIYHTGSMYIWLNHILNINFDNLKVIFGYLNWYKNIKKNIISIMKTICNGNISNMSQ